MWQAEFLSRKHVAAPPSADLVKILTKYVLKEHAGPLIFSLSALTSLLLLNSVAKQLGQLVGKGLPWQVIAEFLLLSVPFTIAMTLPMAVLVATLHAFSRMASENEITALKASGVSIRGLMLPVALAAGVLTVTMVWFMDQVLPRANHELQTLSNDIARKKPTFALKEQVINEVQAGKLYLRAMHLDPNSNRMRDVTIFDLGDPTRRRTVRADSGRLELTADRRDLLLTLYDGSVVELTLQEPGRLQRNFFSVDLFKVRGVANQLERDTIGGEKSDREMTVCELQQRAVRARHMLEATYGTFLQADPKAAREYAPPAARHGIGSVYCRKLATLTVVRSAYAAEAPQSPQAPQVPVPAQQAPAIAPSSGIGIPAAEDAQQRAARLAGYRIQLAEARRVVDGNEVEIEKKFAIPAACVIFVLLGAPIALRFPRGGVGLTIGVSLGVFGLYYVGLVAGETLARGGWLSPFWAMWTPNIILSGIGGYLTARLGSEGTTTRGSETTELLLRLRERFAKLRRAPA